MGVNITIEADGAPCNNNLDMFQEIKYATLIQKTLLFSPTVIPAYKVFELATINEQKLCKMNNLF